MFSAIMGVAAGFSAFSTEYTTPGTQTVAIPSGANTVTVECIASGGGGRQDGEGTQVGGGGGAYSKRTTYSLAGLTGIYISVPAATGSNTSGSDAFARENSAAGTVVCLARPGLNGGGGSGIGGDAATGTGDVKYSGGNGASGGGAGGGAGTTGNGGTASGSTGGAGGGTPAGAGGNGTGASGTAGSNYGGGGGAGSSTASGGAQGWIKLSWA